MSISSNRYRRYFMPHVVLLFMCLPAYACDSRTELEQVFCQLRHDYRALPSLEDFRRNTPAVQRLLLKRPAAKEGIHLPDLDIKKSASLVRSPATSINQAATAAIKKRKLQVAADVSDEQSCELTGELILCGAEHYHLVENKLNKSLFKGSLGAENRLSFISLPGQTDAQYRSDSYRVYIESMLSIGLGASTMSYTKFVHSWQQAEQQGLSAESRFSEMFNYLKRDKKNLSIKRRYDTQLPTSFSWCQSIAQHLIVCDNRERNWVYLLAAPSPRGH